MKLQFKLGIVIAMTTNPLPRPGRHSYDYDAWLFGGTYDSDRTMVMAVVDLPATRPIPVIRQEPVRPQQQINGWQTTGGGRGYTRLLPEPQTYPAVTFDELVTPARGYDFSRRPRWMR